MTYPLRGFDDSFLEHDDVRPAARAKGYDSPRAVWQALSRRPDLAVVDALAAPRRDNWGFGVAPDLRLHGFFIEDGRSIRSPSWSATRAPARRRR